MAEIWTNIEVEAIVADYFAMLSSELRGEAYSKAEHRRNLASLLNDRSHGSIERKHQNISALLIELGLPYIGGYKPLGNYQSLLAHVVEERVSRSADFISIVEASVATVPHLERVDDILKRIDGAPEQTPHRPSSVREPLGSPPRRRQNVNYLELEALNGRLGRSGEKFVMEFERARLERGDKGALADRVEHTAVLEGDGAGFDIRSFELDGTDRLIEVKTTKYGKHTPFYVTKNEVRVSSACSDVFALYRVFAFGANSRLFCVRGSLEREFLLDPVQYVARR